MTHAWWGDLAWFRGSRRSREAYFGQRPVSGAARRLESLGVGDWFVHAGPATAYGDLPPIDAQQARLLTLANRTGEVLAWVGGVVGKQCFIGDRIWRQRFVRSCGNMVQEHALAGIHLNIEPCASFEPGYLPLLEELRATLGRSRLSVAAYPPPSVLHPHPAVHWSEDFYREVTARVDDLAVMMYDTALSSRKVYTWLVAEWTREVLQWSSAPVRIGIPAYEDDVAYHDPETESVHTALRGLAGAVGDDPPPRFAGWAVYAEWTLDDAEQTMLRSCTGRRG